MPSVAGYIALGVVAIMSRVEDPWPDTIGTDLPFTLAAVGATVAGVVSSLAAREKREWAIKIGMFWGFSIGVVCTAWRCSFR
ncbi:MAG TPA: hypothetical protein VFX85_10035 [Solirubrobacterales bacterium]|nr:hypothetical protein [Solirubrobacterales bacterium]